jgi:glycine hydroxymethyltransferase
MTPPTAPWLGELRHADPEIFDATVGELRRQEHGLELIASENFASRAVMQVAGTWLTNKYAEGVAGRRYYGGCEMVDVIERLACERACSLFGAEYANVQPHSGTQANMAVFMHLLAPGDTMVAMDLDAGGHLTHGSPVNFSGKLYQVAPYGVRRDDERLDYDAIEALVHKTRPKLLVAGASAYSRTIDFERFGAIAKGAGVPLLVDMAHLAGLVAAGVHPSPVPHADFVTTTTHKTLRGSRGGLILSRHEHQKALDRAVCPRIQGGPLMHVIAGKAVAFREAAQPGFRAYQERIVANARGLAEGLEGRGYRVVSGGTDNHLVLVDLRPRTLTGAAAEAALGRVQITVNKNKVPFDPQKPLVTSGIRLGTSALTTRGMQPVDMRRIAELIADVLDAPDDDRVASRVGKEVRALADAFPLYDDLLAGVGGQSERADRK